MIRLRMESTRVSSLLLAPMVLIVATCENNPTNLAEATGDSRAYTLWQPLAGECSVAIHNKYAVVGPDGLRYPTWHPPVDPQTGCSFGHEHGRDPRGSDLYEDVGPMAFGYANQQLEVYDPANIRNEDHFGHKVEWENDIHLDSNGGLLQITCDVLAKLHQGTHSKDAFTNNVHEIIYHIRCSDRTEMHIQMLTAIGTPGEFVVSCDRNRHVRVGPATPANSPNGGGHRAIPDRSCVENDMLVSAGQRSDFESALRESWETSNSVRTSDGHTLASFDPYFQVIFPSRFYDASRPDGVGRPIEVCYEVTSVGERARGGECDESTHNGTVLGLTYNDPRSAFNGVLRFMDVNGNRISNSDGPNVWYTDPYGRKARTSPFPGSIKQWIAKVDNDGRDGGGPVIGRERNYGGTGVHAPN